MTEEQQKLLSESYWKTRALEGVLSTLLTGLSVSQPGLVGEVKRITKENIQRPGQPAEFVKALKDVLNSIENITIHR